MDVRRYSTTKEHDLANNYNVTVADYFSVYNHCKKIDPIILYLKFVSISFESFNCTTNFTLKLHTHV